MLAYLERDRGQPVARELYRPPPKLGASLRGSSSTTAGGGGMRSLTSSGSRVGSQSSSVSDTDGPSSSRAAEPTASSRARSSAAPRVANVVRSVMRMKKATTATASRPTPQYSSLMTKGQVDAAQANKVRQEGLGTEDVMAIDDVWG